MHNAVPTLFTVPNPPPKLASTRPPPKRRRTDLTEAAVFDGDEAQSLRQQSACSLRTDHTYCASSETTSIEDDADSATCAVQNVQYADSQTTLTDCTRSRRTIRRKVWNARERKLRKMICRQRVTICRLRKKLAAQAQTFGRHSTLNVFEGAFGKRVSDFFVRQSLLSKRRKFGRRYSPKDKNFALCLYFAGPLAYSFCQQLFVLPSKRTLQLWLAKLDIKPGFCESVLALLGKKVRSMNEQNKLCVLLFDEMSLKTNLTYNASQDVIQGFEDFGPFGDGGMQIANSALVFMVKGLCAKWKQPIGYFLSHNTAPAEKLKALVVRVVICDQGSTNQQMFRLFGVSADKPCVNFCGKQVVFMFDPPHLLKNVRNNLMKHDFVIGDKRVCWKYIKQLYESDSSLKIRMAPKLTKKHIELPAFSAMRVCLAAQVLSHTVAAGIYTYITLGKLPDDASSTAEFVKTVDGLFDCFNSRNLYDKKALRRPVTDASASSHWSHLEECVSQLKALKVVGSNRPSPCFEGWVLSINALKLLWSVVHDEHSVSYLLTSRLNQDSLENFFSLIRSRGGHRDNPDAVHFQSAFKQMVVKNMFVPPQSANCQDDCGQFLLEVDDFSLLPAEQNKLGMSTDCVSGKQTKVLLTKAWCADISLDCDMPSFPGNPLEETERNVLMYIAGYVCKRILDSHNCAKCRSTMLRDDTTLLSENDIFCSFKGYNRSRGNFGGLKAPSEFVFNLMSTCEQIFSSKFDSIKHTRGVKCQLLEAVVGSLSLHDLQPCIESQKRAVDIFMTTRLHYALKFLNRGKKTENQPRRRKNRKAMKIMHK